MTKVFASVCTSLLVAAVARPADAQTAEEAAAALKQSYQAIDKIKDRAEQKAAADKFHGACEQFVRDWSTKVTEGPALATLGLAQLVLGNKDKSADLLAKFQAGLIGKPAPQLGVLHMIGASDHQPLDLAILKGKVVLIEFWATWSPPCRAAVPHLIDLHQRLHDKGLVVVGATQLYGNGFVKGERKGNLSEADEVKLDADYKDEAQIPYQIVVCDKGAPIFHYGVLGLPTLALIDRAGNVRDIQPGPADFGAVTLKIQELLDESGN